MSDMPQCVFVPKSQIDETLETDAMQGKRLLEPLKSFSLMHKLPMHILEDQAVRNEAEVHMHEADLWFCLEGEVTFVYGGELVEPWVKKNADGTEDHREWKAKEIKNGTTVLMHPGDWLWIPAGEAHQHFTDGTARLTIIKIPMTATRGEPGM